jgi:type VI secretion system protein ImpF
MAEPLAKDRLNPALLDRLTDNEPDKQKETVDFRSITAQRLRESILRDLTWLFNATQHEDAAYEGFPLALHSVTNFGIPALSGRAASGIDFKGVEQLLQASIIDFEPRLMPDTVRVKMEVNDEGLSRHNVVSFRIEAQMWAQPYPIELQLKTELDMESGESRVLDASRG